MNVLSRLREELLHYDKHSMWDSILKEIDRDTSSAGLTVEEGAKRENSDLNRYRNVLPYDQTRVVLPESGYINANYVTLSGTDLDLILTQGPLLGTVGDFWKMVWNEHCENIIMLSGFTEGNRAMCHPYLPMKLNSGRCDTLSMGTFDVKLVEVISHKHFEVRKLTLRCNMFHRQVSSGRKGPTVVHCSAGVGRSGSFAVIYGCIKMLIQTPQQLRFCWDALISATSCLKWRCAFGIPDPSTSSNGEASKALVDQSSKDEGKLYSRAVNTGRRSRSNGPMESGDFCWRRYDERYMDRVRRRKLEAEKMRTRLMAMKEKMNRERDDRLFYYILFFLFSFKKEMSKTGINLRMAKPSGRRIIMRRLLKEAKFIGWGHDPFDKSEGKPLNYPL
ncbi:Y phosphatase domain containing protein [Trichuris trichiura]|uniref:Y phosphatase domain containing protein n=1 Tax=Trichuris trichiura TaxID=36087 RepID=A0A077ZDG9_TRITR|nr:Y phosphatase domain containing protein [Trichuris trichiura]